MRIIGSIRPIAAAAVALAGLTAAQAAWAGAPEKIDCQGGEATISGEHRVVQVANCRVVRVVGSHDDVSGVLPRKAKVIVTGDYNTVRLSPPEGSSFSRVKDTGKGNSFHGPGSGPTG